MKNTCQIIKELKEFVPVGEDSLEVNEVLLDNILEDLFKNSDAELVIPSLFELIENYPEADFGGPGPIVHTLENFVGQYEEQLFKSLKKNPVPLSVLMLNRIINSISEPIEKNNYIEFMRRISISEGINEEAKSEAKSFYDFQMKYEVGN